MELIIKNQTEEKKELYDINHIFTITDDWQEKDAIAHKFLNMAIALIQKEGDIKEILTLLRKVRQKFCSSNRGLRRSMIRMRLKSIEYYDKKN